MIFLLSVLVPVSAGMAHLPTNQVQLSAALFGVTFVQMALAGLKWSGPSAIAALHPVGALVVFGLGVVVARRAWTLVKAPAVEDRSAVAPEAEPSTNTARGA